jgi:D-beta-D-heptose 7-phosphate kinase/D-beta-D-heptose 1-phosphate adenosyltransferase
MRGPVLQERLVELLKDDQNMKHIVVVGDLMLDEYLMGSVSRISPEAPVPVFREESYECSFGGATNVAINCKHVGCGVDVIGVVGQSDQAGKKLISMLSDKNIGVEGVIKSPDRVTTTKKRIVAQQQQLLRIDAEQTDSLSVYERDNLICHIHTVIKPGSLVLISDYAKGVVDNEIIQEVIDRAKLCEALVLVDPKGPNFDKYRGVHYLKPNLKEFGQMVDFFGLDHQDSIVTNGRKICKKLDLLGLVITMGGEGLQFVSRTDDLFYPACKREVYDITGAGDTVLAFLAVGLVNEFTIEQSLRLANLSASVAVSHHKTYAVSLQELLDNGPDFSEKIYDDWKPLKERLDWLSTEQKKKIVFANGCFDLLHSGHIYLLQEAKKRGDVLVVALNTDESIKRYKGNGRPVKSLQERAKIIAAIDGVDYVVFFDQDTPYKLIDYLRPDLLVKGGDYELEKIVGYDLIKSYGGKVEIVTYQDGHSTTKLVESLKN